MRKTIVKVLILTAICILSFAGCDSQKGVADNSASVNPTTGAASTVENGSTAKPTETKKEPTEDPTTTTEPTKAPSVTTSETTVKPIVTDSPTKTPATSTTEPTKAPTTTEPTKGPTVTIDPTKDYSEWGYYGFENLLPEPLPFSDETKWLSLIQNNSIYNIRNDSKINSVTRTELVEILKSYIISLEKYGFNLIEQTNDQFIAMNFESQTVLTINISLAGDYFLVVFS